MARTTNEDRHRDVLDAAVEVIREKGLHGASIADIAAAAGVSKSTLFHYFSSKGALVERLQARLREIAEEELDAVPASPPEERLRALLHVHASHCVERVSSPVLVAFLQQWGPPTSDHGRQQVEARAGYEQRFVDALTDGIATGALRAVDPRHTALGLLGTTTWMAMWYRPEVDGPLPEVVDRLLDAAFNGLRASL